MDGSSCYEGDEDLRKQNHNMTEPSLPRSSHNLLAFFVWLRELMYFWVRSSIVPKNPREYFKEGQATVPVCYVLKSLSVTDLFILDHHCEQTGLPRPIHSLWSLKEAGEASFIYLGRPGLMQQQRQRGVPSSLTRLIKKVSQDGSDIALVPVSVFWGRNPGKEEKSLFKLLFFDDEHGGLFQRFVTFFVQGRSVFCHFGKPISLKEMIADSGLSVDETSKKLRRVLKVHFHTQREIALGPHIYDTSRVIAALMRRKAVLEAIESEAKRRGEDIGRVGVKAQKYCKEVSAAISPNVVRFYDIILTWLWRKIFGGVTIKNEERIRDLAANHTLVYMPSHRSHLDYLLLSYIVYHMGLLPPHIVAGKNLDFWPIGSIFRRGGAIFIRRTFKGDRLYSVIVREYLFHLLEAGFSLSFYPEGGRSRSGKLLKPKLGILSMLVQSRLGKTGKPLLLVPVYIGYDKVMEARSYLKELGGSQKKTESVKDLLKVRSVLKSKFGRVYLSFGEPLDLDNYLGFSLEQNDAKVSAITNEVALEIADRTNRAAVIAPMAFFSTILLAAGQKAVVESELLAVSKLWIALLRRCPYTPSHDPIELNESNLAFELKYAESLGGISRYPHAGSDVIFLDERQSHLAAYYRNNVAHLFALPGLICSFFRNQKDLKRSELLSGVAMVYLLFKEEYCIHWQTSELEAPLACALEALIDLGFLRETNGGEEIGRVDVMAPGYFSFKVLAEVFGPLIDRYAIYSLLLVDLEGHAKVNVNEYVQSCLAMAKRYFILMGRSDFASFDSSAVQSYLSALAQNGLIDLSGEFFSVHAEFRKVANKFDFLVNPELGRSMSRSYG